MIREWDNRIYQKRYHQLRKLTKSCNVPQRKFIFDINLGIIKSSSIVVQKIARSMNETIALDKVTERLRYHLQKDDFDTVKQELFKTQCKKMKQDSYIIVDESAVVKPHAKKMEGLSKVWDATQKKAVPGYKIINFIGCTVHDRGYNLIPIASELHSEEEEDTRCLKTINMINETTLLTGNKYIYVMDRGYDSRQYLETISYVNENQFVIRLCGTRKMKELDAEKEKSFLDMRKTVNLSYEIQTSDKDEFICGVKQVKIRIDPTPRKDAVYQTCNLVVCRYKDPKKNRKQDKAEKGGFFYFLCNYHNKELSDEEIIRKTLTAYRLRWKIEETHRQIKQDYEWDKIRQQKLQALKNLNLMLWIVICFLFNLDEYKMELSYVYVNQMTNRPSDVKINPQRFIYYRLRLVLNWVFRNVTKYCKIQRRKKTKNEQLTIAFSPT